jgi:hypothetical protein
MKDMTKQMYKTVNKLIDEMGKTEKPVEKSKGLLNRTSRGMPVDMMQDTDAPLLKVVRYVKEFRKMREGLKNG